MEKILRDKTLYELLEKVDIDLAKKACAGGCLYCGEVVHRSNYPRKPRGGGPLWDNRHSFCCAGENCRRRLTPQSVRFLGRKVYLGVVVVLVSAMTHGINAKRADRLRQELGIDARTLKRWRQWWLSTFVESSFWKAWKGSFMPPVDENSIPSSLIQVFKAHGRKNLLKFLKFLSPLTTNSWKGVIAF